MIRERQTELDQVLAAIFPAPKSKADDELLKTARNASNGAAFSALFDKGECSNPSEGDLGLCNMLAFYAGPDPDRIDRLFRGSALMRAKWDEKRGDQTYGAMTIAKALEDRTEFYSCEKPASERPESGRSLRTKLGKGSGLTVHSADLSKAIPPRWAWEGRLVLGYLNLLIGNEGIGKGVLIAHLIARLTHGELPGDYFGEPISVGVVGDEDSFDGVWTPRLHAAGADLSRVKQIEQVDGGFVNLKDDQKKLAAAITEHGLGLLFLDALLDNLGVSVDDWKQKPVRDALQPARAIARSLDIAVLGSLHPNKRADTFRQLVSGTVAFNAVSRSSLLLGEHPEDELRRVLVRGKGNLAKRPPAFEFRIKSHKFNANKHQFDVPLACEFDESELTIDDLLGDTKAVEEHSKVKDACEIIEKLLPHDGEWHEAEPIFKACKKQKIGEDAVKRAKRRLILEHSRTETFPAAALWRWGPLS